MKKLSCSILLITVLFSFVRAQQNDSETHTNNLALKFAPLGLAIGTVNLGAEYNFSHRNSITVVAGIPFDKTNTIQIDGKKNDVSSKAFSLLAGYRHYLGKKTMSGFYIEPFVKYQKINASGDVNKVLQGQNTLLGTNAQFESIGLGAQFGIQFIVAKIIVFDLYLVGPEANSTKFSSLSTVKNDAIPWSEVDKSQVEQEIKDYLKDIPFVGGKIGVTVNKENKTIATNYSGFIPGFRAGASMGIRF